MALLSIKFAVLLAAVITIVSAEQQHDDHHDDHQEHHKPKPYHFGYEIHDKHGKQHREEQADGHGNVKGSYGFVDNHGVHRVVHYVADHNGFRAEVKTNEKGTANQDPSHVHVDSSYHPQQDDHHDEQSPQAS